MEKVEERRLKKAESIHKVEKILNYVFDNRQDIIKSKENVVFVGKIGPNVEFYGVRAPWFNQRNKNIKDNLNNLDVGFTQINMRYLNESKQFKPLCCITIYRRIHKKQMEFVGYHNESMDKVLEPFSPYFTDRYEFAKVPTKNLDIYQNINKEVDETINIINASYDVIDEVYDVINISREKSANVQKLKKLNIQSTADLITTQDDGQEL
ncbi:MAG: hypothetical protein J5580_00720 [Clostridia bacterium]|nr:hypothetical protein [Clostridia bacterium]